MADFGALVLLARQHFITWQPTGYIVTMAWNILSHL
jgi:hypothetical protein